MMLCDVAVGALGDGDNGRNASHHGGLGRGGEEVAQHLTGAVQQAREASLQWIRSCGAKIWSDSTTNYRCGKSSLKCINEGSNSLNQKKEDFRNHWFIQLFSFSGKLSISVFDIQKLAVLNNFL